MTPITKLPPRETWTEIIAAGWRHGWLSLKPAEEDPKKVKRAEQNRAQYERRKKEGV